MKTFKITGKDYHSKTVEYYTMLNMDDREVASELSLQLRLRDMQAIVVKVMPSGVSNRSVIVEDEGSYTFKSEMA